MRTILLVLLATLFLPLARVFAEDAPAPTFTLKNEKVVFPATPKMSGPGPAFFSARLSPDGAHVLYSRPIGPADAKPVTSELILFNLTDNTETILPTGPIPRGYDSVATRYGGFDPSGKRLILSRFEAPVEGARPQVELIIYDVASGDVTPTGIRGQRLLGSFGKDDQQLIVLNDRSSSLTSTKDFKLKPISALGWVQSTNPSGSLATIFAAAPPPADRNNRSAPKLRFLLWDLEKDQQVFEFSTHSRNGSLDDVPAQWSKDGRYIYYVDADVDAANPDQFRSTDTRAWDVKDNRQIELIVGARALGAGPTPTTMVLAANMQEGGLSDIVLHDAVTGQSILLLPDVRAIHSAASKVLYVKPIPAGAQMFIADIEAK